MRQYGGKKHLNIQKRGNLFIYLYYQMTFMTTLIRPTLFTMSLKKMTSFIQLVCKITFLNVGNTKYLWKKLLVERSDLYDLMREKIKFWRNKVHPGRILKCSQKNCIRVCNGYGNAKKKTCRRHFTKDDLKQEIRKIRTRVNKKLEHELVSWKIFVQLPKTEMCKIGLFVDKREGEKDILRYSGLQEIHNRQWSKTIYSKTNIAEGARL